LASALKNLPRETFQYKGIATFAAAALDWLDARALTP
jgi:hypothetical protein